MDDVRGTAAYRRHALRVLAGALPGLGLGGASRAPDLHGQRPRAARRTTCQPQESLLFVLRDRLGLPGAKNACEQGECGSCSITLDGRLVCACLVLAAQAEGADIRTVEGLAPAGELHPVQEAFLAAGAVQCGFCTPGLVVAVTTSSRPTPTRPTRRSARRWPATSAAARATEKILDAVRLAARA